MRARLLLVIASLLLAGCTAADKDYIRDHVVQARPPAPAREIPGLALSY